MSSKTKLTFIFLLIVGMLVLPAFGADRTTIKQGWNLFTAQQDIQIGRDLADRAEANQPLIDDNKPNAYLNALGQQLVRRAPGERYPYQFKILDEPSINANALPGGFIYVTRGAIEAAQNEPELAGLLAHQIAHVALRHGSQNASQAYVAQVPSARTGRVDVDAAISRIDVNLNGDSPVIKYSREAERQADIIATQIMVDAGFDPQAMTQMMQRVRNQPSNRSTSFYSSHPDLANRAARVRTETQNMGGTARNMRGDSPDFHSVKNFLMAASDADRPYEIGRSARNSSSTSVELPSTRMLTHREDDIQFRYPDNWTVSEDQDGISLAPEGGVVSGSLAYGMKVAIFRPQTQSFGQTGLNTGIGQSGKTALSRATSQLVDEIRQSNPNMRMAGAEQRRLVDGQSAAVLTFNNDSPIGGAEVNWLVTVLRPDGTLRYFVGVAPQPDYNRYASTFDQIVGSARFIN